MVDAADNLLSEDGPWSNDTVTYTYHANVPRLRTGLSLPPAPVRPRSTASDFSTPLQRTRLNPNSAANGSAPASGAVFRALAENSKGVRFSDCGSPALCSGSRPRGRGRQRPKAGVLPNFGVRS